MKKLIFFLVSFLILSFFFYEERQESIFVTKKSDFIQISKPPKEVAQILKTSCYDCHSLETKYPSYSKYFPISLVINRHINEAREHVNFSDWSNYNTESKNFIIQKIEEEIQNNKMPMSSYKLFHEDANLNKIQKQAILTWLKSQKY